jgi:hypothetical protein
MRTKTKAALIPPSASKRKARYWFASAPSSRATRSARSGNRRSRFGVARSSDQSRMKKTIRLTPSSGSVSPSRDRPGPRPPRSRLSGSTPWRPRPRRRPARWVGPNGRTGMPVGAGEKRGDLLWGKLRVCHAVGILICGPGFNRHRSAVEQVVLRWRPRRAQAQMRPPLLGQHAAPRRARDQALLQQEGSITSSRRRGSRSSAADISSRSPPGRRRSSRRSAPR